MTPDDIFPANFTLDVFKALLGTLIGAGLAFWFALRKDYLTKREERKAAGNYAVLTLLRQTDDYLRTKAVIGAFRDDILKHQPKSPLWMLIKPMHLNYSDSLKLNLDSLVFLLEHKEGASVVEKLLSADRKYHDFFSLLVTHAVASEEGQRKLSDAKIDPREGVDISELEKVLGFQLVAKIESLVRGIFNHFDRTDATFNEACDELPKLLRAVFGKKGVIRIQLPDAATLRAQAAQSLTEFD
jgi:hypothetical protein